MTLKGKQNNYNVKFNKMWNLTDLISYGYGTVETRTVYS